MASSGRRVSAANIWLVYYREMRDQLRDRRMLFTIVVLPLVLYPLLGSMLLQVAQLSRPQPVVVAIIGHSHLPTANPLINSEGQLESRYASSSVPINLILDASTADGKFEELQQQAKTLVEHGTVHLVAIVRPAESTSQPLDIALVHNAGADASRAAHERFLQVLSQWNNANVLAALEERGIGRGLLQPTKVSSVNVAPPTATDTSFWSKLLPFVMLVWALTGAFYPAIDLVAGEKERGTLETLLCSPALRSEIVIGKMAAVTTFSISTAVLNVISMLITGTLITNHVFAAGPLAGSIGAPPIIPLLWLWVALVPLSALFSALALAVAALARSSKEGQYYLMPLMMLMLPLVMLPMMPGMELNAGTSLIPVTGMFLLSRTLVEGQYWIALGHLPLVVLVMGTCLWLATRWAAKQFEDESVLFRGGEQWSFGSWMRHLWRDRQGDASVGQAFGCAAVILVSLFFAKLVVGSGPRTFAELARVVLIPQIGLILAPALLMACVLTRSLRQSLAIHPPRLGALFAALCLGISLHPSYVALGNLIQSFYPLSPEAVAAIAPFEQIVNGAPWWSAILVLAIIPALCEELAFRGFIFTGLSHNNGGLRAVLVTALLFGLSHGVLQQSIAATVMGLMLGWVTLRTGSLVPALLIHITNNSLSLSMGRIAASEQRWTRYFLDTTAGSPEYAAGWTLIAAGIAITSLYYLANCRSCQADSQRMASNRAETNMTALQSISTLT